MSLLAKMISSRYLIVIPSRYPDKISQLYRMKTIKSISDSMFYLGPRSPRLRMPECYSLFASPRSVSFALKQSLCRIKNSRRRGCDPEVVDGTIQLQRVWSMTESSQGAKMESSASSLGAQRSDRAMSMCRGFGRLHPEAEVASSEGVSKR